MIGDLELRKKIIETGKRMAASGLVTGTGGNISARTERGFLITPSGMDYFKIVPEDIVEMDFSGNVICGTRRPSVEKLMHLKILRGRKGVGSVIHVHSVYACAFAAARRPLPVLLDTQAVMFGGEIPVADHAPIGTEALADSVVRALGDRKGVLIANHGSLCAGADADEALVLCESLEYFAKVAVLAASIGGGVPLSDEEALSQAEDMGRRYGQR